MRIITKKAKYHEVLTDSNGKTCHEVAEKISTKYPEILIDACKMGIKQKRSIDGVTHIATCVSSWVSQGRFPNIHVDDSVSPRVIKVDDD